MASTAILVRALRELGADVDWYLPSRTEDGYGLSAATVERLAARGTRLLITVDCGDHRGRRGRRRARGGDGRRGHRPPRPRADGVLPDAPIVHPAVGGLPVPRAVRRGRRAHARAALLARRHDAERRRRTSSSSASPRSPTACRCAGRTGGSSARACARWRDHAQPGLRALMEVGEGRPERASTPARSASASRRASTRRAGSTAPTRRSSSCSPRTPSAPARSPRSSTVRTPSAATSSSASCFEAEAQVAEAGERSAYVLAGEGWHPGVIGIVASRIAERHHRPCVLDRPRRRRWHRLGPLDPGVRPARRAAGVRGAPRALRRAPRGCRLPGPAGRRRRVPGGVRGPRRRPCCARRTSCRRSASTRSSPATSWA